ncbi:50S ribosomal protein L25 [Carbonactinospora thermoautotrophica]|uniref:Large ribosomal subunit protein bL25 n=1 Tax=Carbonactinospora thermoautotrophica TaxID=1469144 RepID=A0A132MMM5_9ACTN|nr:50S ribosomal protein L25/general stress protein Ctc [Carbonactinospora thermoautotrophica]KWW99102.1 50S ribosomal protein L25 [Carbonactinospora thermoautotrophica]KWX05085.1 50S ribosomal protein L25 [Carbonactinospora thermoautotrophica]KWX06582.1 50S ribosomal protein L25 [Carbonactinospora thermoautotrophica]
MSEVRIVAEPRTEFGKGAARRIRRANKVPAVLYSHGSQPVHITLPGHELMLALKTSNVLLNIELNGTSHLALPKDVQRHPIKGFLEHVDLLQVRRGEKVEVSVPVVVTGEPAPGGLVTHELDAVEVTAEATHVPETFEVSVEGLRIGASTHARDIQLPEGVELVTDPDAVIVHIVAAPTAEQVEAELAEAEAAVGIEREATAEAEA